MRLKSQIGKLAVIALSIFSMSVFAASEKIKCHSVEFFQKNFTNNLPVIMRFSSDTFLASNYPLNAVFDDDHNQWMGIVAVRPNKDYDYNFAHKNAPKVLSSITKVEKEYAVHTQNGWVCYYRNKAGERVASLTAMGKGAFLRPIKSL